MAEPTNLTLEEVKGFDLEDVKKLTDEQVEQLDGPMQAAIKEKIGMANFRTYIMGEGRTKARVAEQAAKNGHVLRNAGTPQLIKVGTETEKEIPAKKVEAPDSKKVEAPAKDVAPTKKEETKEEAPKTE